MAFATSVGVVSRPKGLRRRACDFMCMLPGMAASAGVSVIPACTMLQRMPYGANSRAIDRARLSSATFAAATAALLCEVAAHAAPQTVRLERKGLGGKIDELAVQAAAIALIQFAGAADILPVLNIGAVIAPSGA